MNAQTLDHDKTTRSGEAKGAAAASPSEPIENVTDQSTGRRQQTNNKSKNVLPPLFLYIEAGNFRRAAERAKRHPREVRTWASIKIKSSSAAMMTSTTQQRLNTTKRLALHQACFKVRALFCAGILVFIRS